MSEHGENREQQNCLDDLMSTRANDIRPLGNWYLVWDTFDSSENNLWAASGIEKIQLLARDDIGALLEARACWKRRMEHGQYKGWDEVLYPRDPRVVFEINPDVVRAVFK